MCVTLNAPEFVFLPRLKRVLGLFLLPRLLGVLFYMCYLKVQQRICLLSRGFTCVSYCSKSEALQLFIHLAHILLFLRILFYVFHL